METSHQKIRDFTLMLVIISMLTFLAGCIALSKTTAANTSDSVRFKTLDDFSGSVMGVRVGGIYDQVVNKSIDNVNFKYYDDFTSILEALKKGDIDALPTNTPVATLITAENPDVLAIFPEPVKYVNYGYVLKKGSPLTSQFSEIITDLTNDGTIAALQDKWISDNIENMQIDWSSYKTQGRSGGTLRLAYESGTAPMTYTYSDGKPSGYEVELFLKIADKLDMNVEFMGTNFGSLINYVESDKADAAAGCISITDERKQAVDFPISHYSGGVMLVCRKKNIQSESINLNDDGTIIAVEPGIPTEAAAKKSFPNADYIYVNDATNGYLAVSTKKADAYAINKSTFESYLSSGDKGLHIYENKVFGDLGNISVGISPVTKIPDAKKKINDFLAEMKENGTLVDMQQRWVIDHNYTMPDIEEAENPDFTVVVGTTGLIEPYSFYIGTDISGFDIELMKRFALWCNAKLVIDEYDWNGITTACTSGKADYIMSSIFETQEKRDVMEFSTPYTYLETVLVVSDENNDSAINILSDQLTSSFNKTFIKEGRWKLIVNGLLVTLEISVFSGIIGTFLGFLLCIAVRSRIHTVAVISRAFCTLMQGIPSLVVLMITYFVIFGSVKIDPVIVGVIAFSALFAVSVSGILNTGINAVDKGQWEASVSLGFNNSQTFVRIIMPQAVRHILPLYKGEFVSLMKMTSIVGYISIQDLTKAGDIIRSRTYEAFFPLIVTAIIYFVLSSLVTFCISRIETSSNPRLKARAVPKGVEANVVISDNSAPDLAKASANSDESLITIEHLKKCYPNATPLKDVNTVIKRGEVITIIGPSGTGKSTLMRCINRLEIPTEGKITVFGKELSDKSSELCGIRKKMGMVFQSFNLFANMNIIENVMFAPVILNKCSKQEAYENGMKLLRMVGMAEKALNYPDELSGGQKQRAAIARTLAM